MDFQICLQNLLSFFIDTHIFFFYIACENIFQALLKKLFCIRRGGFPSSLLPQWETFLAQTGAETKAFRRNKSGFKSIAVFFNAAIRVRSG